MPRISQSKRNKISEQILHHLFTISPQSSYTISIAKELARDEEFILSMLKELESKKLIVSIFRNKAGKNYIRRKRWRLSNEAYDVYKKHQTNHNNLYNSIHLKE